MSGREGQEWHLKRNSPFRDSSYIRDHNYRRKTKGRAMQRIHEAEQNEESWHGRTAGLQTHHAPEWQNGHGYSASGAYDMGCGGHEPDDGYPSQEQPRRVPVLLSVHTLLVDTSTLGHHETTISHSHKHKPWPSKSLSQWTMLQGISSTPPMPMTRCANQPHPPTSNKF